VRASCAPVSASSRRSRAVYSGKRRERPAGGYLRPEPWQTAGFGLTERRRSRTHPAWGYQTSPVLKTMTLGVGGCARVQVGRGQRVGEARSWWRLLRGFASFGRHVRARVDLGAHEPGAHEPVPMDGRGRSLLRRLFLLVRSDAGGALGRGRAVRAVAGARVR